MDLLSFTFAANPEQRLGAPGYRVEVMTTGLLAIQSHWVDATTWEALQDPDRMMKLRGLVDAGSSLEIAVDEALGLNEVVRHAARAAARIGVQMRGTMLEESVRESARVLEIPLSPEMARRAVARLSKKVAPRPSQED